MIRPTSKNIYTYEATEGEAPTYEEHTHKHAYTPMTSTHTHTYRVLWRFCTTTKVRRGLYCGLIRVHAALMAGTYFMGGWG